MPLRIAQLTATFPPYLGGAGNVCFQMARGLAQRGHHVEVFTAPAEGQPPDAGGAVVHRLDPLLAIGNAPLIPKLALLDGFDVLHLHYPFMFGAELTLASRLRRRGAALVVSYHNRLIGEGYRRSLFWLYEQTWGRLVPRSAARVCVLSEAHADTVPSLRGVLERDPARIAVLPNGVDLDSFSPGPPRAGLRQELGLPEDATVAVTVATLDRAHYFKRLDLAIEALALAKDDRLHLLVVGGGEWLERYRQQAAAAGLEDRVHFAGAKPHDALPEILRASSFLVLPSDLESFGLVVLEAMACGLPVLATDLPGVRALIDPGASGVLVPRGDARAISAGLDELAALDPPRRAEMGMAGRRSCERDYSWPAIVEQLEGVYREALGDGG